MVPLIYVSTSSQWSGLRMVLPQLGERLPEREGALLRKQTLFCVLALCETRGCSWGCRAEMLTWGKAINAGARYECPEIRRHSRWSSES